MDLFWLSNNSHVMNGTNYKIFEELSKLEAISSEYHFILWLLYSMTAFVAFTVNLITIIALFFGKKTSQELSKYLINLSISDLMMSSFSIPFTYTIFMYGEWLFHPSFCPVVLSLQLLSVFVSVYTLIAIGIDRYYAIVRPLDSSHWLKIFPRVIILLIWTVGLGIALVTYFNSQAIKFQFKNQTLYDCRETWDEKEGKIFTIIMFCITYAFPILVLTFVYSRMAYVISNRKFNKSLTIFLRKQKNQIVKLMVTVVMAFIVCWTGIQFFILIIWLYPEVLKFSTKAKYNTYVITYFTLHWISMFHSCVNPFIYSFMSENFRSDLRFSVKRIFNFQRIFVRMNSKSSHGTVYSNISIRNQMNNDVIQ